MRIRFIILFCFISIYLNATLHYVAPTTATPAGNDSNPGTIEAPWATWSKAFNSANAHAGDTIYFRGGVYYATSYQGTTTGIHGTAANLICFFNYPDEIPILDGRNKTSPSAGLMVWNCSYLHIKGLTIRYHPQLTNNTNVHGIYVYQSGNITLERCVVHNIGYRGFNINEPDNIVTVINCDSYNNADSLSTTPGNAGDGFIVTDNSSADDTTSYVTFRGCRAWHNSDDGWDIHAEGYIEMDGCWAFNNGYLAGGNGTGIKLSLNNSYALTTLRRKIVNCISAFNKYNGITTNDRLAAALYMNIYNNICYHNGFHDSTNPVYGIYIYNSSSSDAQENRRIFKNNISYANEDGSITVASGALYTHSNNSWDIPLTLNDADFESVDSTGITGVRQASGALPDLDFLHPASGGDMIDAGINVGLIYDGAGNVWDDPPSIGAYELPVVEPTLITSITISAAGGATTIEVEGGTLQMYTNMEPDNATDTTKTWSVVDGTGHGTIDQDGLLTAGTNGTVMVWATANDDSGITDSYEVTISNQNPDASLPAVSTGALNSYTAISAIVNGWITDDGGSTTTRGICWGLTSNPDLTDNVITEGTGEGIYQCTMTGLNGNTVYHFRAYGTNIEGTAYGVDHAFTTPVNSLIRAGGLTYKHNGLYVIISNSK